VNDGVTEVYSSAHSATNNVSGDVYNMNGYFSDYYNTYEGQSPDSGGYGDSYPSSDSYASTTSSPGFSFTWDGWNVQSKQGVYIHNSPYSGEYSIPYGLGSWSNPVEQPNSAYSTTPETPAPYTTPSQRYVDDIDDFFYGYDNAPMYETAEQEYGEITVTNASGSASYSSWEDFHDDFVDELLGNIGSGSELTETQKTEIGAEVFDNVSDVDNLLSETSIIVTYSYSYSGGAGNNNDNNNTRSGQNSNTKGWWSPYRWFWTGDGHTSDEVLEAALTAGGNSYFENAKYAHAGLNALSHLDQSGIAETTNQALYDMEEGKSLPQIALNAGINLTYNRVVDKVSSKAPVPDENPANKIGFAGKSKNATERANSQRIPKLSPTEINHLAQEIADKNGWARLPGKHYSSGMPIYDRGKGNNPRYVSPDRDMHNGCFWKGANKKEDFSPNKRTGSYDKDMNWVKD